MSVPQSYRDLIARTRQDDETSRARRRRWRNEQQERLSLHRNAHTRDCFLRDTRLHLHRRSVAEENVMYTLRSTAACWADVCDRAITRQLDVEAVQRDHAQRAEDYLTKTHQREVQEQRNTEESDTTRWAGLNAQYALQTRVACTETVAAVVTAMLSRTSRCLTALTECRLHHAGTELLTALCTDATLLSVNIAADDSTAPDLLSSSPFAPASASAGEAFERIFHGNPYAQSSAGFLDLLRYAYKQYRVPARGASVLLLCPIPILVVDGPKYSGKTLLTSFLASSCRLLCTSDESLVRRALLAAEEADAATHAAAAAAPSPDDGEPDEEEEAVTPLADTGSHHRSSAEWAAHGRRIRACLFAGGAVGAATVVELLYLLLQELREDGASVPYDALLLEGVFRTADTYKAVAQRLHSQPSNPYTRLAHRWGLAVPTQEVQREEATQVPLPLSSAPPQSSSTVSSVDVPALLRLPDRLVADHDSQPKPETKARPVKKVDLATLPPAELPEVEDTHEAQATERGFVAQADRELASLPTVLSGVLHIQCSPEEVFRRFAGLRVDLETGIVYHLTYNPPPPDRLPHVVNPGRPDVSSVELHEAIFQHREQWAQVLKWLGRQPDESTFARVYELTGDGSVEQLRQEALQAVEHMLSNFRISRQVLVEREAAARRLTSLDATQKAQIAAREAERARLASVYTEKGVQLPPLLQTPTEGTGAAVAVFSSAAAGVVLQAVAHFTSAYDNEYGSVWRRTAQLVQMLLRYFNGAEEQVHTYWKRPDDKQAILSRYQNCFDGVPPAMRALPACKAQLHASLDGLSDALHRCIELRDAEAKSMMEALCSPATFVTNWEALVCQGFTKLLQREADRFVFALHLFTFFFGAVTGEPLAFDEVEVEVPAFAVNPTNASTGAERPVHTPGASGEAPPLSSPSNTARSNKEKRVNATKKTHGKAAEELPEKTVEEQFAEVVHIVLGGMSAVTEKLKSVLDGQTKGQKRTGGASSSSSGGNGNSGGVSGSFLSLVTVKCLELMEAERVVAATRVNAIHHCLQTLLKEVETHAQHRRFVMEALLTSVMQKEAAAANTAVYVLRGCVECETRSPRMHLGCTTFAVLPDGAPKNGLDAGAAHPWPDNAHAPNGTRSSFLTDVPLSSHLPNPQLVVHTGLTAARLFDLIQRFRCVAPNHQLSRFDFLLFVEAHDYTEAIETRLDGQYTAAKSQEEIFEAFDPHGTGFVDWREVVVHLLFWVVPAAVHAGAEAHPPTGIPEVSLQELCDTRDSLVSSHDGLAATALTEEQFFGATFFYDRHLEDKEALREMYTRVLWETFHEPATHMLCPYALLGFLCADPQPVRGAQKAFQVLSAPDAAGCVSIEEMDAICHHKATNARAMNQPDPCSKMHLRLLFGNAATCSFADMCISPIGRKMLNHADLFRRRSFVKRK